MVEKKQRIIISLSSFLDSCIRHGYPHISKQKINYDIGQILLVSGKDIFIGTTENLAEASVAKVDGDTIYLKDFKLRGVIKPEKIKRARRVKQ